MNRFFSIVLAQTLVMGLWGLTNVNPVVAQTKAAASCQTGAKAGNSACRTTPQRIPLPPYRAPEPKDTPKPETDLQAAPVQKPSFGAGNDVTLKAPPATNKKSVREDATPEELLAVINESLTSLHQFNAKFSQVSGNGQQSTGRLTVLRPGRLRFDYDAPATITIIADGNNVAILDTRLKTQDVYAIGLTPLKFLLGSKIDLAHDFTLLDIRTEGDRIIVDANDTATFGGVSQITLAFDAKSLLLKQWSVTDPQGYEVKVSLSTIDTKREPDPSIFVIPPRFSDSKNN